jgi:hypothetical protein
MTLGQKKILSKLVKLGKDKLQSVRLFKYNEIYENKTINENLNKTFLSKLLISIL